MWCRQGIERSPLAGARGQGERRMPRSATRSRSTKRGRQGGVCSRHRGVACWKSTHRSRRGGLSVSSGCWGWQNITCALCVPPCTMDPTLTRFLAPGPPKKCSDPPQLICSGSSSWEQREANPTPGLELVSSILCAIPKNACNQGVATPSPSAHRASDGATNRTWRHWTIFYT